MLSLAVFALSLSAAPPKLTVRPAPVFIVFRTATTPAQRQREERLHDEVSLLLDNFAVLSQPINDSKFATRSLAEQLTLVLDQAGQNDAIGVLWVAEPSPGQLMLHVVGIGTGRSLIRTLEFDQRSGSEKALAVIVRELLGTAFLQSVPEAIDPGLAEVVRGVRRELPKDKALEPPPPQVVEAPPPLPTPWSVSLAALSSVALAGAQGRWLSVGAQLRGERALTSLVNVGVLVELHGARDLEPAAQVSSLELPFGVTASLALPVGAFALVPRLSVLAGWNQLWAVGAAGATSTSVWTMRTRLGFGVRTERTTPIQFQLELSGDLIPVRGGVRDIATGLVLWRAPVFELQLAAGIFWKG